jgi:peptide-methionine (S)-S-oxide reductase
MMPSHMGRVAWVGSKMVAAALAGLAACGCSQRGAGGDGTRVDAARAAAHEGEKVNTQKAMFGAGCFWGVEERFRTTPGVVETTVGYAGGKLDNPTYQDVCTDRTGHAEVVLVEYDPQRVTYEQLLDVFWNSHNPTQLNRQGPDVGTQYRSVVFYFSPEQQAAAEASKERLAKSGKYKRPIVTEIAPAAAFWRAEEYHQKYLMKRGKAACAVDLTLDDD